MNFFKKDINKVKFTPQSIYEGHHRIKYRGIETVKAPFDYVMYQMIIFEIKPDLIIEIGTMKGGSALYLADILDTIGKGEVHTIDVVENIDDLPKSHSRIKPFHNGWENYDLELASQFENVMVIEDSLHTYQCTLGVLNKFKDIVSPGSYLIVEDGIIDELKLDIKYFEGGPLRAIHEFLEESNNYLIDRKWCDMFGYNATFNVNGYLKREY